MNEERMKSDVLRDLADGVLGRTNRTQADPSLLVREYIEKNLIPANITTIEEDIFSSEEIREEFVKAKEDYKSLLNTPGVEKFAKAIEETVLHGGAIPFDMNPSDMKWYLSMASKLQSNENDTTPLLFENPVLDFWKSMAYPVETPYKKIPTYIEMVTMYLLVSGRGEMPLIKRLDIEKDRPVMARLFDESSSWLFFNFLTPEERMDEEFDILDVLREHSQSLFEKRVNNAFTLKSFLEESGLSMPEMFEGKYNEWRGKCHIGIPCSCCKEYPHNGEKTLVLRTTQGGASGREEIYCEECMEHALNKVEEAIKDGLLLIDEESIGRESVTHLSR